MANFSPNLYIYAMGEGEEEKDPIFETNGNTNSLTSSNTSDRKVTHHHYGKVIAKNTNSNPQTIESSLDNIYDRFLTEQQLNDNGIQERISKLRAEVLQKRNHKIFIVADISTQEQKKEEKDQRIEDLELDKLKVKEAETPNTDYVPFVIGSFIVVLLTLYLFVFYSSTGYSAFYGVKQGALGFINPNVFTEAQNQGGGVIALIILFPVIFLGLGFLIHDALEKNKYIFISGLLIFTLLTDSIIGYKISQGIYINEFNAGIVKNMWEFRMIYYDINFYLIIALGFVVYIIWGALLHYILNKYKELQPDQAIELRIDNLNRKISEQRLALAEISGKINILKSEILTIENEISEKEKEIIGYENGVVPVNISLLKASIGDFMNGWFAYTTLMYPSDANKRTQEAKEKQENWLSRKIESLS